MSVGLPASTNDYISRNVRKSLIFGSDAVCITVNFDENKEILYTLHIGKSGKGVVSIEKTKTENGMDIFTILYTDGSISTYSVPTTQNQTSYVVFSYIGFALALIALVILMLVFIGKNKVKKKKLIKIKYDN